jgi:hypothetical protein
VAVIVTFVIAEVENPVAYPIDDAEPVLVVKKLMFLVLTKPVLDVIRIVVCKPILSETFRIYD